MVADAANPSTCDIKWSGTAGSLDINLYGIAGLETQDLQNKVQNKFTKNNNHCINYIRIKDSFLTSATLVFTLTGFLGGGLK